jgi:hypothetical protein
MNIWLAGLESGATYVGQIRGFANPIPSGQYHIALKVVYPNRFEISYVPLTTKSFVVPFAFITVPQLTGVTPNVQFFPLTWKAFVCAIEATQRSGIARPRAFISAPASFPDGLPLTRARIPWAMPEAST